MLPFTKKILTVVGALSICFVFAPCLPVCASPSTKPFVPRGDSRLVLTPSSKKQRIIHFPPDFSLGEIHLYSRQSEDKKDCIRCAARGNVVVPPEHMVRFTPGPHFYQSPEILKTIDPYSIDKLMLTSTTLEETESFCDKALVYVGHLKGLSALCVDKSDASDAGLAHAAECPNLQKISAMGTSIDGSCFKQLSQLKLLNDLHIPRNKLKAENLRYLVAMPSLSQLNIGHSNLKDESLKYLAGCTNIDDLVLGDNPEISDGAIKYLASMKNLRVLLLYRTAISLKGVMQLKSLPLYRLELPNRDITDQQLAEVRKAFPNTLVKVERRSTKHVDSETRTIFAPLH